MSVWHRLYCYVCCMSQPAYPIRTTSSRLQFAFESINEGHVVQKRIEFTAFPVNPDIYNLAFGDLNEEGVLDDLTVSNNQDMERVLATVIQALVVFLETYPNKTVFFTGSTVTRTRLYRAAINRVIADYEELRVDGIMDTTIERFQPNKPYQAFLVRLNS